MTKTFTHRLLALDVWGNAKDGYEINDLVNCDERVELNDCMTDKAIIKAIRASLGHRADSRGYYLEGDLEYQLEVYKTKDSKPCYFTRHVERTKT